VDTQGLLQAFRSYLAKSKSPHTARLYARAVEDFVRSVGKPLDRVTALDVSVWQDRLLEKLSRRSVDSMSAALKTFFKVIGRYDLAMAVPSVRYEAYERGFLPEGKVVQIIEAGETLLEQAVLATGYELALRVGEVPLLRRNWFSYELLSCQVQRLKRKGATPAYDVLPMRKYFADKLKAYLDSRTDRSEWMFVANAGGDASKLKPIHPSTVEKIFRRAAVKVGGEVAGMSWHTAMRHSKLTNYAIQMLEEAGSIDLVRLMKLAGHVSEKSTLVYVHLATSYYYSKLGEKATSFGGAYR